MKSPAVLFFWNNRISVHKMFHEIVGNHDHQKEDI